MNGLFKKYTFVTLVAVAVMPAAGCAKKPDKDRIIARVNDYKVTMDDFKREADLSLPGASREQVMKDLITRELLVQESQKIGIDKNPEFMKEIEDYWKQTLIKQMISRKGNEFLQVVKVSPEEIQAGAQPQESSVNAGKRLRMQKAQILLNEWLAGLGKNSRIEVYAEIFNALEPEKFDKKGE
jgi:hypothetical protein